MSEPAIVVITVRGIVTHYETRGDVKVAYIDWDELEESSLGALCRTYKLLWLLPEDLRRGPLTELIGAVQRRFPIEATFHPQRLVNGREVPAGQPFEFDVTEALLLRGPNYIDNLRDDEYPVDDLAENLLAQRHHDGPFMIDVQQAAMEFLFADENEVGDAENRET
jgi:hypothetical protein